MDPLLVLAYIPHIHPESVVVNFTVTKMRNPTQLILGNHSKAEILGKKGGIHLPFCALFLEMFPLNFTFYRENFGVKGSLSCHFFHKHLCNCPHFILVLYHASNRYYQYQYFNSQCRPISIWYQYWEMSISCTLNHRLLDSTIKIFIFMW